jgi:hypothetical protein
MCFEIRSLKPNRSCSSRTRIRPPSEVAREPWNSTFDAALNETSTHDDRARVPWEPLVRPRYRFDFWRSSSGSLRYSAGDNGRCVVCRDANIPPFPVRLEHLKLVLRFCGLLVFHRGIWRTPSEIKLHFEGPQALPAVC